MDQEEPCNRHRREHETQRGGGGTGRHRVGGRRPARGGEEEVEGVCEFLGSVALPSQGAARPSAPPTARTSLSVVSTRRAQLGEDLFDLY